MRIKVSADVHAWGDRHGDKPWMCACTKCTTSVNGAGDMHVQSVSGNMDRRLDDVDVHTQMFSFVNVLLTWGNVHV